MLKILQQQASVYLQDAGNLLHTYQAITSRKDQVLFFQMLLYQNNPDTAFDFISQASAANSFEPEPFLTAIWAYSLHLQQ